MREAWSTLHTEKRKKRIHVVSQQTLLAKNCTDVLRMALPTSCKKRYLGGLILFVDAGSRYEFRCNPRKSRCLQPRNFRFRPGQATNTSARGVFQFHDRCNTLVFVQTGSWSYLRTIQSYESFDDVVVPATVAKSTLLPSLSFASLRIAHPLVMEGSAPLTAFFSCGQWSLRRVT